MLYILIASGTWAVMATAVRLPRHLSDSTHNPSIWLIWVFSYHDSVRALRLLSHFSSREHQWDPKGFLHTNFWRSKHDFWHCFVVSYGYPIFTDPTEAPCVTLLLTEDRVHKTVYKTHWPVCRRCCPTAIKTWIKRQESCLRLPLHFSNLGLSLACEWKSWPW